MSWLNEELNIYKLLEGKVALLEHQRDQLEQQLVEAARRENRLFTMIDRLQLAAPLKPASTTAESNTEEPVADKPPTAQELRDIATKCCEAALQGDQEAQNALGVMHGRGDGVIKNFVRAYAWFHLSAAQGNEPAQKNRALLRKQMTAEQINEAQTYSRTLRTKIITNEGSRFHARVARVQDAGSATAPIELAEES